MRSLILAGALVLASSAYADVKEVSAVQCATVQKYLTQQGGARIFDNVKNEDFYYASTGDQCRAEDPYSVPVQDYVYTRDGACPVIKCVQINDLNSRSNGPRNQPAQPTVTTRQPQTPPTPPTTPPSNPDTGGGGDGGETGGGGEGEGPGGCGKSTVSKESRGENGGRSHNAKGNH